MSIYPVCLSVSLLQGSGGIPHAAIALARLGVGTDARGKPLRLHELEADGTLNVPLIDKDKGLRFLLYAT
jgi:hypothetical protein